MYFIFRIFALIYSLIKWQSIYLVHSRNMRLETIWTKTLLTKTKSLETPSSFKKHLNQIIHEIVDLIILYSAFIDNSIFSIYRWTWNSSMFLDFPRNKGISILMQYPQTIFLFINNFPKHNHNKWMHLNYYVKKEKHPMRVDF